MAFTLWSLTLLIWVLVSILCATAAIFAFMQPFWVVNHVARKSFGLYGFCSYFAEHDPSGPDASSPWLDPLTGAIVDVIVVDGGGFEVVGGLLNNNNNASSLDLIGNVYNITSLANQTTAESPVVKTMAMQKSVMSTVTSCGTMFGSYYHFNELFTAEPAWKTVGILYALSTSFLCIAAIISVVVMFLNEFDLNVRRLCRIAGIVQLVSLGLFIMALAIFPAIMPTKSAGNFCPAQSISLKFPPSIYASTLPPPTTPKIPDLSQLIDFATGNVILSSVDEADNSATKQISSECHFGWAFVLAAMNTLICVFLPILSHFVVTEPDTLGNLKLANL